MGILKLLIVDDEEIEREGIRALCNWTEIGVQIVGAAWNGEAALKVMEEKGADLVITDVKMPVMNGLDFSEQVKERFPSTKIIFISGYEDFEAARSAITLNAFAYLLKPANPCELLNAVKRAANISLEEKFKLEEGSMLKKQLSESMPLLKEKFIREALLGINGHGDTRISERARFLGLRHQKGRLCVAVIEWYEYAKFCSFLSEEDIHKKILIIMNEINAITSQVSHSPVVSTHEGEFTQILYFPSVLNDEEVYRLAENTAEASIKSIKLNCGVDVTIGLSSFTEDMEMLPILYEQARKSVNRKFYLGYGRVLWYEDELNTSEIKKIDIRSVEEALEDAIWAANLEKVSETIDNLFSRILMSGPTDKQYIQSVCMQLVSVATRILSENNKSVEDVLKSDEPPWLKIIHFETISDISRWLSSYLHAIAEYLYHQRQDHSSLLVQNIKEIIHKDYASNLTNEDIARKVFLAPGYIRRVFKNKTGITLQEYITEYRIKKAAELLKDPNIKVQDAAIMIGYESVSYFCSVFKEYRGITPGEYRNGAKRDL